MCPKEEKIGQYISFFKSPISVSVVKFEYKGSLLHLCFDEHFGGQLVDLYRWGRFISDWSVSTLTHLNTHLSDQLNFFFLQPKTIQNDVV